MTATRAPWVGLDLEDKRYHVLSLLGEGGMASIFKAIDRQKDKEIVLKVPKPALLADPEFVHRFAREIRTLVELKHPSVVAVYGFGRHNGVPFAVLEFLSGGTLADQPKPCQPKELGAWLPDVAVALDHIHKAGYVHRDVKPGNILFDAQGRSRLADFGIIKSINEKASQQTMALTESGVTVGTPEYMAPELAKGHSFDGKVDQYALAVTVYERLSGRRPIEGGTGPVILVKQIREKPKPLDEVAHVSPALAEAVGRALAKDPKNRFPSCFEFARAVMNPNRTTPAATKVPPSTRTSVTTRTPLAYEPTSTQASWVLPTAIGGGVLALLLFAVGGWLLLRPTPAPATPNNVVKIPISDAPPPVVGNAPFRFKALESAKAIAGKPGSVIIAVHRTAAWLGPIKLVMQPSQNGVMPLGIATIAPGADSATLTFRLMPNVTTASLKITGSAGEYSEEITVPLDVVVPRYSVMKIDDVQLAANEELLIAVNVSRDGWEDEIVMQPEPPQGVIPFPTTLRIPPGSNETSFRIRSASRAFSGPFRLIGINQEEKARFNVTVSAASAGKTKTPIIRDEIGTLIGRQLSELGTIAFCPRDPETLVAWDQSHLSVWETGQKHRTVYKPLDGIPSRGTLAPDGKRILTATKNKIYIHDLQGKELTAGPNRYRIVGMYFDVTPSAVLPYFWTPSGLCNAKLTVVQPGAPGANAIKYSTAGSGVKLSETDGKLKLSGKKSVTFASPKPDDFAVSHDGRWVAIAASGKVLLYDTDAADPTAPMWEKDVPGTTAIAISPDGKTIALGVGKDLRLLNVKPQE
jgi:serine/threonine protein kinase